MAFIFHIIAQDVWEAARHSAEFRPASLDSEGFIHFSGIDQIERVANVFYRAADRLGVLVVDTEKLSAPLRYEPPAMPDEAEPPTDELFPHLYGALNTEAVTEVIDFPPDADGIYRLSPSFARYRKA